MASRIIVHRSLLYPLLARTPSVLDVDGYDRNNGLHCINGKNVNNTRVLCSFFRTVLLFFLALCASQEQSFDDIYIYVKHTITYFCT